TLVRSLTIRPAKTLLTYNPVGVIGADWIPEASLRNSEDWFNLYPLLHTWTGRFQFSGPSSPWAIAQWFSKIGYKNEKWGLIGGTGVGIQKLQLIGLTGLIQQGYRVVLLINHELEYLNPGELSEYYPDHYVGMVSGAKFTSNPGDTSPTGSPLDADDYLSMRIFSHRNSYDVGTHSSRNGKRASQLTAREALKYIWGYAAGRY
ncbi:MAG: hypothetical protein ACR2PF_21065, partial [Rhizobiaceae bacterium]